MNKEEIKNTLKDIGLSDAEISVFVALLEGYQSARDIVRITGEKRPTVYYAMNSLEKRGLVSKTGKEYGNTFQLEPLDTLSELVNKNIRKHNELLEKTEQLKKIYPKNKARGKTIISHFDSSESVRMAIFYSLYAKSKTIRTIIPADNFFDDIGSDFKKEYVEEKMKRGIRTKALWEDIPKSDIIKKYYKDSNIKQLPIDMHNSFQVATFIFDDKTLYIYPMKEQHAVLIESKSHAEMMVSIFENIWSSSLGVE